MGKSQPFFYAVCLKQYDSFSALHGTWCDMIRAFHETGKKTKKRETVRENGVPVSCCYSISSKQLKWKKKSNGKTLEQVFLQKDGYCRVKWDQNGKLVSKTMLNRQYNWVKTQYYGIGIQTASVLLTPGSQPNTVLLQQNTENGWRSILLQACPVEAGSMEQSRIDSELGEPMLRAFTDQGEFCYCNAQEKAKREALLADIQSGAVAAVPIWDPAGNEGNEEIPDAVPVGIESAEEADGQQEAVEPVPEALEQIFVPHEEDNSYSANHELFHVDVPEEKQEEPERYAVASKNAEGALAVSDVLESVAPKAGKDQADSCPRQEPETEPAPVVTAAKHIVVSAQESYEYFGMVVNGLRQGRGRTQKADGQTAYEGDYYNDKRDGFGAYYYNTGKICYVGDWKENKRHGTGVSFRPDDSSIHVGRWEMDTPQGVSSVFDREGNLKFSGRLENGSRQGVGVSFDPQGETLFVGKWKDNQPTGEGSEFDSEGNLLYKGSWQNGRRHGVGTEYSKLGAVLFTGTWKNGIRDFGVLYVDGVPQPYLREKEE